MTFTLEDYICRLHTDSWYTWTDSSNKVYANLALAPKMMNEAGALIDNPYTLPSESDCTAGIASLQATWDGNDYERTRADAYAEIKDQLDQLYHDMAADKGDKTGEWFKAIKAVKDANPKP